MSRGRGPHSMRKLLWVLIPIVILIAIRFAVLEIWGGVDGNASSILRHGDRVEVFRISSKYDRNESNAICGYKILATGKEQGPEFAARLSRVLHRWGVAP